MRRLGIIFATVLGLSGTASADEPELVLDRGAQVIVTDPNYQAQQQGGYQQQPQNVQVVEQTSPAQQGRGLEYGGSLFVPIWLGDPAEYWNPGIGIDLRAGWELGRGLSLDGHLGFTYNGLDDAYDLYYDSSLQSVYLGFGARYAFLNRSALVPFVQGGLQLNLWSFCSGDCTKSSYDTVNFGLYGGGGLAFEVNANMSVDFGVNVMGVLGNNSAFFTARDMNIQPFLGASLYY